MKRRIAIALLVLSTISLEAQTWRATSIWDPRPVPVFQVPAGTLMPIPGLMTSPSMVSFLTTTADAPVNLIGATLRVTVRIETTNAPVIYYGTGGYPGPKGPNLRLYFSTVPGPYSSGDANARPTNYWWAGSAEIFFGPASGNFTGVVPGVSTVSASIGSMQWSDSQGHPAADPRYRAGFLFAAGRARELGVSFGGGNFFDTGVGKDDRGNPAAGVWLTVLEYRVIRPVPRIVRAVKAPREGAR
jgi:hypothetical protein